MRNYLLLLLLVLSSNFYGQTNFSKGFDSGFKRGYCQNQGISCIPPIPPIAPLPNTNENMNSYEDGFARGVEAGLNANKKTYPTSSNDRQRYETSEPKFVENKMSNSNQNLEEIMAIANALKSSKDRALSYIDNKNYQAAIDVSFAGLRVSPYDSDFMLIIGQAYRESGNASNAIKWLNKALRNGYDDDDGRVREIIIELQNQESRNNYTSKSNKQNYGTNKQGVFTGGFSAGTNINNYKTSFLIGGFFGYIASKKNDITLEVLYFENSVKFTPNDSGEEILFKNDNIIQFNLFHIYHFNKKIALKYGPGISSSTVYDLASFDLNAGLQYYINHHLFLEVRANSQLADLTPEYTYEIENAKKIEKSPFNLQLTIGYKF